MKRTLFLFILLIGSLTLFPQKKTALVLSGGGASAVAHIGVIKALEEQNIQIDYIVGVSMGAIVGAMYACGMTPEEMESYFKNNDIEAWVNEHKDSMEQNLFMQDEEGASLVNIDFDIEKKGVKYGVPTHFISANRLNFELMKIFTSSGVAANDDFDHLMIPFRCVATDIDDNQLVTLREGSLYRSIRASMTFPFLLDPIRINGVLLFDGGMLDNFPVSTAIKEFNPDIIIGSKAAGNYDSPSEDNLMSIIENMLTKDADFSTKDKEGFVIELKLPNLGIVDFSLSTTLIDSAYRQMNRLLLKDSIKNELIKSVSDLKLKRAAFDAKKPDFKVDSIIAVLQKKSVNEYVNSNLKRRKPIQSFKDIELDFLSKAADPSYKRVHVALKYNYDSESYKLIYSLKKSKPYAVNFGGNISSSKLTMAYLKLAYQTVGLNRFSTYINAYFGQFYRSVKGNIRIDIPGKYPIAFQVSGTYNHKNYFRGQTYFFEDEEPSFLKEDERFFEAQFSSPISTVGKVLAGMSLGTDVYNYYQNNNFTKLDTSDQTNIEYSSPFMGLEISSLNKKQFADRGLFLKLSMRYIGGIEKHFPGSTSGQNVKNNQSMYSKENNFFRFKIDYTNYFLHYKQIHIGGFFKAILSNQTFLNNYTSSILSAEQFSPSIESMALFIPNYRAYNSAAIGGIISADILSRLAWRTEIYLYQPYERILPDEEGAAIYESPFSSRFMLGTTAFIYNTRIGPVSFHLNYYDGASDPWSLMFSFGYVIFNKMSLE